MDTALEKFKPEEKSSIFNFLCDSGIPINQEGKPNWNEIREKNYADSTKYEAKSAVLIEKLIQEFRLICHQINYRHNYERFTGEVAEEKYQIGQLYDDIGISSEDAEIFYHNTNVLKFIRKTLLFNNIQIIKSYQQELLEQSAALEEDYPAFFSGYKPEIQDLQNYMIQESAAICV